MLRLLTNSQTFVLAVITTDIAYCVNITTIDIVFFSTWYVKEIQTVIR